ncbi:MFS transporter [Rhodobacter sp. NSM]|uniref:MFS transporter n=1 Tax=Rhodobacter sp. NSM TaxID=3457501 RepID=UPI003FD4E33E
MTDDTPSTRLATRLSFFAAGFAMSCWAPLVPFAKTRSGADDAQLGLLLLCLGVGSLVAMPITGWISARTGARPMILLGGIGMVLILPVLGTAGQAWLLALALLLFGASLGTLDVAMNVHAVAVERDAGRPLMSGFHAMFSVGGFAGAGVMTVLLSQGLSPALAAVTGSAIALAAIIGAGPRLLRARGGEPPQLVVPRAAVLLLAGLAAVTFLVEGALLDWGALLLVGRGLTEPAQGGLGYMLFSVAMTIGRLAGDRIVMALGDRRVLVQGGLLTLAGFALLLLWDWRPGAMAGFVLIGLGASNIVPVLFSLAGRQTSMPPALAIAAVTTTGYAGILAGPALIGFASHLTSLPTAFWMLAVMMALVPATARLAAAR